MEAVHKRVHADKLEELDRELQSFLDSQRNLMASLLQQSQNKRAVSCQTSLELKSSECQTMLDQPS